MTNQPITLSSLCCALALAACGGGGSQVHAEAHGGTPPPGSSAVVVKLTVTGSQPGKPPLERLLVDVDITNEEKATRWVFLPTSVPPQGGAGGIDTLEQLTGAAGDGAPTVTVGHFLGTGGRYAIAVDPGVHLVIHRLEIGWWHNDPPDAPPATSVPAQLTIASDAALGGESIATWFTGDPVVHASTEIDASKLEVTASHKTDDDGERPLQLSGDAAAQTQRLAAPH